MKITITFHDLTLMEAAALSTFARDNLSLAPVNDNERIAASEDTVKPKRKRRTKAEMEAARATEAAEATETSEATETQPRRRRRRDADAPRSRRREPEAEDKPSPKRRGRRPKTDDEISDAEVAKAASEGAQRLTPKVVREILDEFGVGNLAELDQTQRREFIDRIADTDEEASF